MKITCTQENLSKGLSIISRVATSRATLPILANILLQTDKGRLKLAATDLEIGITTWVNAKIDEDGGLTVPSRTINEFITTNNDKTIDISLENTNLHIHSEHYEAHIKGMEVSDYPLIPEIKDLEICQIPSDKFKEAIAHTSFAASTDETRPVLNGVNIRFLKNEVKLVATDSYRLAETTIKNTKLINEHADIVVPTRTVVELGRILQSSDGIVKIFLNDSQVSFVFGNTEVISRLVEGTFPAYEQIIPAVSQTKTILKTSELTSALKMSSLFARESANNVKIRVEGNTFKIIAVSPQLGDNTSSLTAEIKGSDLEIAFNARYILDALGIISTDEVILELNEISPTKERKPSVLKPTGAEDYLYIIMPLDLQT